jgi:excisionase family DNA binding protein
VTLAQRSPAPALPRQTTYGQRPYAQPVSRPTQAGMRFQPAPAPVRQRPYAAAPAQAPAQAPVQAPVAERPAQRGPVSFLTVAEVAAIMRVSKMTVYRLVHGGEMAAVRVGRSFRVPEPAVRQYLAGARTDAA